MAGQPRRFTVKQVQRGLQFNIEGARADAAPVYRTKNLDVADGIEAAKALWSTRFHQLDDARHDHFGVVRPHEVEVALDPQAGRAR
jgi:hypothetical protein